MAVDLNIKFGEKSLSKPRKRGREPQDVLRGMCGRSHKVLQRQKRGRVTAHFLLAKLVEIT